MYHSIKIGSDLSQIDSWKDTWNDWHLIPSARPQISLPQVKTKFVDVPGRHGQLDLSETLTGGPVYGDRTGSWSFIIVHPYLTVNGVVEGTGRDYRPKFDYDYHTLISQIAAYIHGRRFKVILEDEPGYYYEGRLQVDNPSPGKDYSTVSISYTLEPYKTRIGSSNDDDWLWDPFNFLSDAIPPVTGNKIL